jgi:SAM-dependent methyltransferase
MVGNFAGRSFMTSTYVIRGGEEGRERLRVLSEVMGPSTHALLNEVGIRASSACLDVGCGGGDVACELALRVGPGGRVVGVDVDAVKVDIARREAALQGITNVAFEVRDVTEWEPGESYDVVFARFLLTHLADPARAVSAMRRHLRPNGVMIVEDIDFRGHFAEPDCPALRRYVELYTRSVEARGADPNIGPRVPALLRAAGFPDVRMRLVHPAAMEGGVKVLTCLTLDLISAALLEGRFLLEDELRETKQELRAFARDPHTVIGGPRVFQVWGRLA